MNGLGEGIAFGMGESPVVLLSILDLGVVINWASARILAALSAMARSLAGVDDGEGIAERGDDTLDRGGVQGVFDHASKACCDTTPVLTACGDEDREPVGVPWVAREMVSKRGGL